MACFSSSLGFLHPPLFSRLLALSLLLSACGKTGVPEEEFQQALAETTCEKLNRCCADAGLTLDDAVCQQQVAWFAPEKSAHRSYNAKAAEACLEAIEISPCDFETSITAGLCSQIYEGTLKLGDTCTNSNDCAWPSSGVGYCDNEGGEEGVCFHVIYHKEGEACGVSKCDDGGICNDGPCEDGLFCNEARRCETPRPTGSSCTGPFTCRSPLICRDSVCTQVEEGDPCESGEDCSVELSCSTTISEDSTGVCFRKSEPGASCASDSECLDGSCLDGVCVSESLSYCSSL